MGMKNSEKVMEKLEVAEEVDVTAAFAIGWRVKISVMMLKMDLTSLTMLL